MVCNFGGLQQTQECPNHMVCRSPNTNTLKSFLFPLFIRFYQSRHRKWMWAIHKTKDAIINGGKGYTTDSPKKKDNIFDTYFRQFKLNISDDWLLKHTINVTVYKLATFISFWAWMILDSPTHLKKCLQVLQDNTSFAKNSECNFKSRTSHDFIHTQHTSLTQCVQYWSHIKWGGLSAFHCTSKYKPAC